MLTEINENSDLGGCWKTFWGDLFITGRYDGLNMLKGINLPLNSESFYASMKKHDFLGWGDDESELWDDFGEGMEHLLRLHPEYFTVQDTKHLNFVELREVHDVKEGDSFLCHETWFNVFTKGEVYTAVDIDSVYKLIGNEGDNWHGDNSTFTPVLKELKKEVEKTGQDFFDSIENSTFEDCNGCKFTFILSKSVKINSIFAQNFIKVFVKDKKGISWSEHEIKHNLSTGSWKQVYAEPSKEKPKSAEQEQIKNQHDDMVEATSIVSSTMGVNPAHLSSNFTDESSSTTLNNGDTNMSNTITVEVSSAPYSEKRLKIVFGNDVSKLSETSIRTMLHRQAKERAEIKSLELGEVVKGSYQDREIKALDAARVALIDALNDLKPEDL